MSHAGWLSSESESEPEEEPNSQGTQQTAEAQQDAEPVPEEPVPQTPSQELNEGDSATSGTGQAPAPPPPAPPSPWIWYPDLVGHMIAQEEVPPPYTPGQATALRLPQLAHPMEQVVAMLVARLDRESRNNRQLRQTCAELTRDLRRTEIRVSHLTNEVGRLTTAQGAIRAHNQELTDEVLSLRARTHPPPFGMRNEQLSHRLDLIEYQHSTLAGAAEGRLDHIDTRLAALDIRMDDAEAELQANQMAAMINPPPEEEEEVAESDEDIGADDDADAQSDISDAMEP